MKKINLTNSIDKLIEEKSLLKHPFYQSWSAGTLTKESLKGYAFEYFQLVKAVPEYMDDIIECMENDGVPSENLKELKLHRQEEHDHIELWIKFAKSLGIEREELLNYQGLEKTNQAVEELRELMKNDTASSDRNDNYTKGATAMYALEKELPKISSTKLDGLKEFYNLNTKDSNIYFEEHQEADVRHAASWKNLIKNSEQKTKLLNIADRSLDSQNLLLDSCYEEYC